MTRYFAYGSNMSVEQMASRCPHASFAGLGLLPAHRFVINTHRYATVIPEPGTTVYGTLWTLTSADEKSLDRYEGVRDGNYSKETVTVKDLCSGQPGTAMIYLARDRHPGHPRKAYIEGILAAARHHKFPSSYILELELWRQPTG